MKSTSRMTKGMFTILLGLTVVVFASDTFAEGTWTTKAPMPTNRYGFATGVVNNTFLAEGWAATYPAAAAKATLYAVGGHNNETGSFMAATVEAYDPITNAWTTKASMPTGRFFAAAGVVNGILYVIGGTSLGDMFATVEAYNPATDTWTTKAPMPAPRYNQAVGVVNGILYAIGGWDGGFIGRVPDVWAYNPATDTWTTKAPMPTGRAGLAAGVVDGTLFAIGGEINGNFVIGTVEAYDPATDTWTTKTSMPTPRDGLAAGVVNGKIYAVGGSTHISLLSTVEAYDPATDTWTTTAPMPTPRSFLGTGVINDTLYAAGGSISNTGLATMEAYTPNHPPVADAGPDQVVECTSPAGASVTLDGSASSDLDGDTLTYTWTEGATTLATVNMATVTLGLGMHTITLAVDDGNGGMDSDTVDVTVQDTTPPSIGTVTASPNSLLPPNHKMMPVTVSVSAADVCDTTVDCTIIGATSNEPDNGLGDGDIAQDIVITGDLTVDLRAERSGKGSGRVYTLQVQCVDDSGNSSDRLVAVTVPHSKSK